MGVLHRIFVSRMETLAVHDKLLYLGLLPPPCGLSSSLSFRHLAIPLSLQYVLFLMDLHTIVMDLNKKVPTAQVSGLFLLTVEILTSELS